MSWRGIPIRRPFSWLRSSPPCRRPGDPLHPRPEASGRAADRREPGMVGRLRVKASGSQRGPNLSPTGGNSRGDLRKCLPEPDLVVPPMAEPAHAPGPPPRGPHVSDSGISGGQATRSQRAVGGQGAETGREVPPIARRSAQGTKTSRLAIASDSGVRIRCRETSELYRRDGHGIASDSAAISGVQWHPGRGSAGDGAAGPRAGGSLSLWAG